MVAGRELARAHSSSHAPRNVGLPPIGDCVGSGRMDEIDDRRIAVDVDLDATDSVVLQRLTAQLRYSPRLAAW